MLTSVYTFAVLLSINRYLFNQKKTHGFPRAPLQKGVYIITSVSSPDLNSTVKWSSYTVTFSISLRTSASSYSVTGPPWLSMNSSSSRTFCMTPSFVASSSRSCRFSSRRSSIWSAMLSKACFAFAFFRSSFCSFSSFASTSATSPLFVLESALPTLSFRAGRKESLSSSAWLTAVTMTLCRSASVTVLAGQSIPLVFLRSRLTHRHTIVLPLGRLQWVRWNTSPQCPQNTMLDRAYFPLFSGSFKSLSFCSPSMIKVLPSKNLVALLSLKASLRGDRRYQFIREGDNAKSILMYLYTMKADKGLSTSFFSNRFYCFSFEAASQDDMNVMDAAMSAYVSSPIIDPVWAVDKLYECLTLSNVTTAIREITKKSG